MGLGEGVDVAGAKVAAGSAVGWGGNDWLEDGVGEGLEVGMGVGVADIVGVGVGVCVEMGVAVGSGMQ